MYNPSNPQSLRAAEQPAAPTALRLLRDFIRDRAGVYYEDSSLCILETKLNCLLGPEIPTFSELVTRLSRPDGDLLRQVISKIVIGETWFFRFDAQFRALWETLIPSFRRLAGEGSVVVWAAGCSSGEEAYSLAMTMAACAPELCEGRVRILATDINSEALERARAGRYLVKSATRRNTPLCWRHLIRPNSEGAFVVPEGIRRLVTFLPHNLVDPASPPGLVPGQVHLISCRNVLIYFDAPTRLRVLDQFARFVHPNGWLMLGESECPPKESPWERVEFPNCFLYRRRLPSDSPRMRSSTPAASIAGDAARDRQPASGRASPESPRGPAHASCPPPATGEAGDPAPTAAELVMSGIAAEHAGDDERACASLRQALFLDRGLVLAHFFLGTIHERRGERAEARRYFRNVSQLVSGMDDREAIPLGDGLTAGFLREHVSGRLSAITGDK